MLRIRQLSLSRPSLLKLRGHFFLTFGHLGPNCGSHLQRLKFTFAVEVVCPFCRKQNNKRIPPLKMVSTVEAARPEVLQKLATACGNPETLFNMLNILTFSVETQFVDTIYVHPSSLNSRP